MTKQALSKHPVHILLAEDNPGDAELARIALLESEFVNTLYVVDDGQQVLEYLEQGEAFPDAMLPDLLLLDLNLPRLNGLEVLARVKNHPDWKRIPVIILTSSESEEDVEKSYEHHANCFITKPIAFDSFVSVVKSIESFWLSIAELPPSRTT